MRRSIKIGIWSLIGTLTVSGGLALASTLYFNSKNNGNISGAEKPGGNTNNPGVEGGDGNTNNPINPPSNEDNNNNNNDNDANNPNEPETPNPEPSPTPPTPEQPKPEQPKPPANPNKPTDPIKPIVPPSNNEGNDNTIGQTIQTKFKLNEVFDKYKYVQKTTDYQDYFKINKLIFDESKIKINTYSIFRTMIIKAMNIDLTKNTLKINIYYRLNQDSTELKLQVKWGIISNNSLISLEKKYYDNIYIKLR